MKLTFNISWSISYLIESPSNLKFWNQLQNHTWNPHEKTDWIQKLVNPDPECQAIKFNRRKIPNTTEVHNIVLEQVILSALSETSKFRYLLRARNPNMYIWYCVRPKCGTIPATSRINACDHSCISWFIFRGSFCCVINGAIKRSQLMTSTNHVTRHSFPSTPLHS